MDNLIIVHPSYDGQFEKSLLLKWQNKIKETNGQIVILIDSIQSMPSEFEDVLKDKNYKVINTVWDDNFGWVVMLNNITIESAFFLFFIY